MEFLVGEGVAEDDGVIVRSITFSSVFCGCEETNFFIWMYVSSEPGSVSFEEFLRVTSYDAAIGRLRLIVVGECEECGVLVKLSFMDKSDSPFG